MKDTRAEREADRLYSLLSPDAGGYRLSGGRELRPEGTFRNPRTIIEDRRGPSLLRITRNPVTIGGRVVKATPGQRILTLRTEPFAYIADRNLIAFTDMLVRRHMRVHLDYSLDGDRGMRLLTPTDAQMGELGEIIRIYDGRPSREELAARARALHEFGSLADRTLLDLEFADRRHPAPPKWDGEPFGYGNGVIRVDWPDPGDRRVPVVRLMADWCDEPLLTLRRSHPDFLRLSRLGGRLFRYAAVTRYPEDARRPRLLLRIALLPKRT